MTEPSNSPDGTSWPERSPWSDGPPEPPTVTPGFAFAAPEPPTRTEPPTAAPGFAAPEPPTAAPLGPGGPSTVTPDFAFAAAEPPTAAPGFAAPEPPPAAPGFAAPEPPTAAPGIPTQPMSPAAPTTPVSPAVQPGQPAPQFSYQPGAATVVAPTSGGLPPTAAMPLGAQPPGYPVSGPAYPVSAPGYPVSAPGYPVSGPAYPVSGMGMPGAPAKPRRTAVIVLSCLMVLFLVAAGVLGALYYTKDNAYRQQVKTVATREATVDSQKKQIDDLKAQLKSTQDQLTDANQKATGTQNQVNELNHEKQVISQCLDLLGQVADAADRGDRTTANKLAAQADPICAEADTYLN